MNEKHITTLELIRLIKEKDNYLKNLDDKSLLLTLAQLSSYPHLAIAVKAEEEVLKRWSQNFNHNLIKDNALDSDCLYIINSFLVSKEKLENPEKIELFLLTLLPYVQVQKQLYVSVFTDKNAYQNKTLHFNTFKFLFENTEKENLFKESVNWWHIAAHHANFDFFKYLKNIHEPYLENNGGFTASDILMDSHIFPQGSFSQEEYAFLFAEEKKLNRDYKALDFYMYTAIAELNMNMIYALKKVSFNFFESTTLEKLTNKLEEYITRARQKPGVNILYTQEEKVAFRQDFSKVLIEEEKKQIEKSLMKINSTKIKNKI